MVHTTYSKRADLQSVFYLTIPMRGCGVSKGHGFAAALLSGDRNWWQKYR